MLNELNKIFIFQNKNQREITKLYNLYKPAFFAFMRNFFQNPEEIEDIYQDSFFATYQNIREGKFTPQKALIKTYLFEIGKNIALKKHRELSKFSKVNILDIPELMEINESTGYDEEKLKIVRELVAKLLYPCKQVLSMAFWEKKSMKEIAVAMNYKNEQIAKNRKYLCFQKIKDQVYSIFRSKDLI